VVLTRKSGPSRSQVFRASSSLKEGGRHDTQTFHEEQVALALRQAENGTAAEEICRKMGVSKPTFYRWKKQFVGLGVPEIRRLARRAQKDVTATEKARRSARSCRTEAGLALSSGPAGGRRAE
jgi:phage terminase Nu1 subunit (DNA packaging protein)